MTPMVNDYVAFSPSALRPDREVLVGQVERIDDMSGDVIVCEMRPQYTMAIVFGGTSLT